MLIRTSRSHSSAVYAAAIVGFLCGVANAMDPQFFPQTCADVCTRSKDFAKPLSPGPTGTGTRPGEWSIVALNQIKTNLEATSPPGVDRALALLSMCMYEAVSLFELEGLEAWAAKNFKKIGEDDRGKIDDVIDGAAYTALAHLFSGFASFPSVQEALKEMNGAEEVQSMLLKDELRVAKGVARGQAILGFNGLSTKMAFAVGASACDAVLRKFTSDGYDGLARPLLGTRVTKLQPVNEPQSLAGITNCEKEMVDLDRWQPICAPVEKKSLSDIASKNCKVQEWLAPWAGGMTTFAIAPGSPDDGRELISKVAAMDSSVLGGPPSVTVGLEWQIQMMEVVDASAELDDALKLIAEHWADGPDSTAPPGTWFLIAKDAADAEGLDTVETAKLLMLVGAALNDAGVASWRVKSTYDSIRPIQMVQCGFFGQFFKKVDAWRGPYMGVGPIQVDEWQPYQLDTFKTPPFAGYISGHSTFSFAAAEVLKLYFGSDDYKGPQCTLFNEGQSRFERKITAGEEGFVAGVTDIPNQGSQSSGYSPASDVTLCWDKFSDAAKQAGDSRVFGGIHVRADNVDGFGVGKQVARSVFVNGSELFHEETSMVAAL